MIDRRAALVVVMSGGGERYETPDYTNTGGTGDRRAIIALSISPNDASVWGVMYTSGYISNESHINGTTNTAAGYMADGAAVAGAWYEFDFGTKKLITEAKIHVSVAHAASGVFKWQGYNGSTWVDIGNTFTLGSTGVSGLVQTITALSGNTKGYTKYRILGVSGNASYNMYYWSEWQFKIGALL